MATNSCSRSLVMTCWAAARVGYRCPEASRRSTSCRANASRVLWSKPIVAVDTDAVAWVSILTKAGYTKGSDGIFAKGGQKVSLTITDPAAYTDYAEDDSLVAQELKAAGIDAILIKPIAPDSLRRLLSDLPRNERVAR